MLVLSRRLGEIIVIDNDISVTVLGIDRGQVKLGVSAPKDVIIDREEIHNLRNQGEDQS